MCEIIIYKRDGIFLINPNRIIYIRARGSYCFIKLKNQDDILVSMNLKTIQSLLSESYFFYRVHRSWIINVRLVERIMYSSGNSYKIHLKTGDIVPIVSKEKKTLLSMLH